MKLTEVIGITTRNMHVKFEAVWKSYNFWRKNAYSAGPSKQDEILTFSQCSPKFIKRTEFIGITNRNMHVKFEAVRRKLQFLTEKCLQRRTFKTGWNFYIFSMFSKIHETYRIYWNHHQKHTCEIWGGSEKLQFLMEKCLQRRTFKTGWNFDIFSMFSKIHDTYRIYWNHHQKHACEIWGSLESYNFWQKNAYSAGPSKQDEILRFSQCSPKFMKLTEVIGITTRNMHVKFEAVRRSYNFWWKMPTAPDLQNRMKFWLFLNVLQNSWNLQNLLESPPETYMWNLRQFGEVTIFDGKMPTAPDL